MAMMVIAWIVWSVDESCIDRHAVVVLPDELDLATTPRVLADIRRCLARQPKQVFIDVSSVRFLGSTRMFALLEAREQAERRGVRFRLIGVSDNRPVRRMLTIAGVVGLFDTADAETGPRDVPRAHTGGVALLFQDKLGQLRSDGACVTGGYCDEDTGHLQWVAVQPAGREGQGSEWLVPACRITADNGRFSVALTADAAWAAPALSGAPEEMSCEIEDRLWRYYADVVNTTTTTWPMPGERSVGRCYRIQHVRDGMAQLMTRRRVVDCRSVKSDVSSK